MTLHAIVPIRSLDGGKTRLADVLAPSERSDLVRSMLGHVIAVLRACDAELTLATRDRLAGFDDVRQCLALEPDLNAAIAKAVATIPATAGDVILVLAADLPELDQADVRLLAGAARSHAVAIAPDAAGTGTNALAIRAPLALPFRFGPDSRRLHEQAARRLGIDPAIVERDGFAHDIDDREALLRWRSRAAPPHSERKRL